MPSMTQTEAFEIAFAPDPLPDRKIAALDALLGAVESVNIIHGCAELRVGDDTYTVTPNFCAACGAASDQDCPHKAVTRAAVEFARDQAEAEKMQDYADEMSYAHSVTVGMG